MAGKTINSGLTGQVTTTTEGLRTLVAKRYTARKYTVPGTEIVVELAILKRREREAIVQAVRQPDGSWDNLLQNRMVIAYGLISPPIVLEIPFEDPNDPGVHEAYVEAATQELLEYPDWFIDPISAEIWRMSNEAASKEKGGSKATPFPRTNGSLAGSTTETEPTLT